ncbi:GerAB/ArcD/ProY family transporter [Sporosalibacterium faouarense]|uniref:GerAB/ArcD/ProY family transporter n=1 Tax=Sporosalibacterium faouarense TaxID=516123 RepID=UPI00192C2ABD|nr:endospore germination permease [Sporosalibacterium faouarense]
MMKIDNKITSGQLMAIIVNTIIGVGILSLPRDLVEALKTDGWILVLISGLLAIGSVTLITILVMKYPGKTVTEFGRNLITTPISDFCSILFLIYLLIFSAFVVRIFGEIVKMYLLRNTPIEFIIITMLITVAYIARAGIEAIGKFCVLVLPIVVIPIFFMGFVLLPELDFSNLLPVFKFKITDLLKGIPSTVFSFAGFEVILLFNAFVERPKKTLKYNLIGMVLIIFVYLFVFLISVMVFGVIETTHLIWPSMSLMEVIQFPGAFLENVQGVVMAQWVVLVFSTLAPLIYGSALIFDKLFRGNEHKYYVFPLMPIIFVLALVPDNIATAYDYIGKSTNILGTFVILVLPLLLLVVSLFKKNNKKGAVKNG